jgi:hypothetical protein
MISEYVIMKIEHLKREHTAECGIGSGCDCGADDHNKQVDWIIDQIRLNNIIENRYRIKD